MSIIPFALVGMTTVTARTIDDVFRLGYDDFSSARKIQGDIGMTAFTTNNYWWPRQIEAMYNEGTNLYSN